MSDTMMRLAHQIFALPPEEQRLASAAFRQLVERRQAEIGPKPVDPVALARQVGLEPDPWQVEILCSKASRILINGARQTGKSTITSLIAVHTAHFTPDALVLLLSPSLRQSQELFKKALAIYQAIEQPVQTEAQSALRLELKNGSRIVSLPGKEHTVRGYSGVQLLVVDEAARVPDDLYYSVRPMLAVSGGRLIGLSTPFGTRGWWYDAWRSSEDWERYEIPAWKCSRISRAFLEEERRVMGDWWFGGEYECQFVDSETQPFGREEIDRAFSEEVEPWIL